MPGIEEKQRKLIEYLKELGSVAVAFSGGVDSTYLLKVARDTLGENVIAVTARSLSFPKRELDEAIAFAESQGVRHFVVDSEELDIDGFSSNPLNRCYLCKSELFTKIREQAAAEGITYIAEGSNMDDNGDYRPGLQAAAEMGVKSPLRHAGLSKGEIRRLSKTLGLSTWKKQSFACLSSRFPYGESITPEKLKMIDEAEQFLLDQDFYQVRVRHHGTVARIETDQEGISRLLEADLRKRVDERLKQIGFSYVALDLIGYRTGSMNETVENLPLTK